MINCELMKVLTHGQLKAMGFQLEDDGSGDPRGVDWNIYTDEFHLLIDAYCEVKICRINPDTDFITLHVESLADLESVIDWVQDDEPPRLLTKQQNNMAHNTTDSEPPRLLTIRELKEIAKGKKYLRLRRWDNETIFINAKMIGKSSAKYDAPPDMISEYYSWEEISFSEYISRKPPLQ